MARTNPKRGLANRGLEDLRFAVAAGAAANTNIAISGIKRSDAILAVIWVADAADTAGLTLESDLAAEANVTSDGNIQLTTTDTTGDSLLVVWARARGGRH